MNKDLEERLAASRASLPPMPDDVEKRYNELQEELQKIEISPTVTEGETREERYARKQRLEARRREFDRMSRYPLAKRQRTKPTIVLGMIGVTIMLCFISFAGGSLLSNFINGQQSSVSSVYHNFWDNLVTQQYSAAYQSVDPSITNFEDQAAQSDKQMGKILSYNLTSQDSNTASAKLTFQINRKGGLSIKPATYLVTLTMTYSKTSSTWVIRDFGSVFTIPETTPTPSA